MADKPYRTTFLLFDFRLILVNSIDVQLNCFSGKETV